MTEDRPKGVFLDSIGCRLNQGEIERMARQFRAAGYKLVPQPEEGDLIVLNTCTVTAKADSESRRRLRRYHEAQPGADLIATGCWASLNPDRAAGFDGVAHVISNDDKDDLVRLVLDLPEEEFDREPTERRAVPGLRMRTRAYIKAQDGCDHHCTYCLTTLARGPSRSLLPRAVVRQVQAAVEGGSQEAVISGVQLSGYGRDLEQDTDLVDLVRAVLGHTDIARLRLSSLEPWGLPEGFFSLWQDPRLCRQLHLPLQSGCPETLRRMGRPITPDEFRRLVSRARAEIPQVAITTDVITGFPGETEAEFQRSLDFIESMQFADAHVFPYSPRPGTAAKNLPDRIHSRAAKRRARRVRRTVADSARRFRERFVGRELAVLWERAQAIDDQGWRISGLSDNYLRVEAHAGQDLWNQLTRVRISGVRDSGLRGTPLAPVKSSADLQPGRE